MDAAQPRDCFEHLLDALIEGVISDEQYEALQQSLQGNTSARAEYAHYVAIHTLLETEFVQPLMPADRAALERSISAPSYRPTVLHFWGTAVGLIRGSAALTTLLVATLVYGTFGFTVWQMSRLKLDTYSQNEMAIENGGQSPSLDGNSDALTIARLVHCSDCQWRNSSGTLRDGMPLQAGVLSLVSGIAELEFRNGAHVVVEGPCQLNLRTVSSGFLSAGRLFAQVPARAVGFQIHTPTADIVDLGTEFGVEVGATGETAVQVLQGQVDVSPRDTAYIAIDQREAQGRQRLVAGQSSMIAFTPKEAQSGPTAAFTDFLSRVKTQGFVTAKDKVFVPASEVEQGAIGNQLDWQRTLGMDFDVLAPIEIHRLGVFDSGSDGIDPSSRLTVEIWSRNMSGTPADASDDGAGKRLARQEFSAESPGQLVGGNRLKSLAVPLRLEHGTYTMIAWGFNRKNLSAQLIVNDDDDLRLPPSTPPSPIASVQDSWVGVVGPLPVFAVTSSSHYWNRTATQLINGITSGRDMSGPRLEVAGTDVNRTWLISGESPVKGEYVTFDLTGQPSTTQHVATAKVWSLHEWDLAGWLHRGVKEMTIQYSLDGTTWLDVINPATNTPSFTLTRAPAKDDYDRDLSDVLSLGFDGIDTRYVRFTLQSKYRSDNPHTGLNEVRFFSDEPNTKRWVLNDGGGRLLFLPRARASSRLGEFPREILSGFRTSRFLAGTFEFSPAKKPAADAERTSDRKSP